MGIMLGCAHCERGRVMWTGDEYQCVQCGWLAPEDPRELRSLGLTAASTRRTATLGLTQGGTKAGNHRRRPERTPDGRRNAPAAA